MNAWISILRDHKVVRASAVAIFLYGFAGGATSPYQAVIGIRELGLSDNAYAAVAFAASIAHVTLAIISGYLSDRFQSYRRPLLFVSAFGVIGYGAVWLNPTPFTFVIATIGPLALFHATNSMLFGNVRAHTDSFAPEEASIANSLMRMMVSLSWVVVPGIVGLILATQDSMILAYLIAAAVSGGCFLMILLGLDTDKTPKQSATPVIRTPALLEFAKVLAPKTALRILSVALITQVLSVNAAVLPLIVTGRANGVAADIGFLVGMVALLEVLFIFFWAWVVRKIKLTTALVITASLYFIYLASLAVVTAPWQVYSVSILAGIAAAGIISLPISYLLDLIKDRPGISASLIAVNIFLGAALGALFFAIGTSLGGYGTASILGGIGGILGAGGLMYLERTRA